MKNKIQVVIVDEDVVVQFDVCQSVNVGWLVGWLFILLMLVVEIV